MMGEVLRYRYFEAKLDRAVDEFGFRRLTEVEIANVTDDELAVMIRELATEVGGTPAFSPASCSADTRRMLIKQHHLNRMLNVALAEVETERARRTAGRA
ncbi:hypothetical protein [Acuticoccus yangtzensis]|uniref:hypothetical protein n=1 Tax=Acuticoccus yangtzensis TaxID=1443441 RepID=UPI000949A75F|nr:hypothetical protein [Acuticoccus yangtzensis]